MALCPVLKSPCIKDECAWWYQAGKINGCSIAVTPLKIDETNQRLDSIINRLDRAFSEVSYKGERLLGNYADEMSEITAENNKLEKQGHE
jgi:hypothetical protein